LAQHKPEMIRWGGSGQLLDEDGQEVAGVSAVTLADFSMQSRKRALPTGWNIFASALVQAGVPTKDIKNAVMRRAMARISMQDRAEKSFEKRVHPAPPKRARLNIPVMNVY
jgi:hypothetical protein